MSGRGGKSQPRVKRPATAPRDTRGRASRKSRSRKVSDVPEEEPVKEELAPIVPLHRQDSWWYHLPPVEKPDEELHIQLTKERKEALRIKHLEFCRKELDAIFNFAMYQRNLDVPEEGRVRELERAKRRFLDGFYDHKEVLNVAPEKEEVITTARTLRKNPVIRQLLHIGLASVAETLLALSKSSSRAQIEFDANPEMDRLFKVVADGRGPYVTDNRPEQRSPCPFFICVLGPPCTGKSTVCEFITKFYNTKWIEVGDPEIEYENERRVVIDYWDEKLIIPRIIDEVCKLEDETMGVVLSGWPYTRGQLQSLEKALAMAFRKKTGCRFTGVSGLIRTVMTAEEAKSQVLGRLVDVKTRAIYHSTFNPPIFSGETTQNDIVEFVPEDDFASLFVKTNKDLNGIETSVKKTGKVLLVPLFQFIGECQLVIEEFIGALCLAKEMETIPKSFVRFKTSKELAFSKFCADLHDLWNNKCLPIFGNDLSKLYKLIEQANLRIDYLRDQSLKAFELIISRPDDRMSKSQEYMMSDHKGDESDLFHYVWQKSIEVRDQNLRKAGIHCKNCILRSLKEVMEESEQTIFSLILKRYFIVEWFTKNFAKQLDERCVEGNVTLPDPVVPDFDITNLRQLCELMDIQEYTLRASCSRSTLPVPIPLQMESALLNRTQEYLGIKGQAKPRPAGGRPKRPPFASRISFDLPDDDQQDMNSGDTRQQTIKKFLEYVKQEATPTMQKEAEVMNNVFNFFIEKKEAIDKRVNASLEDLDITLEALVRQKCSTEMETFSEKFRKLKRGEKFEGDLFTFDTSFLDRESMRLYTLLKGQIPEEGEVPNIDDEKVRLLFLSLRTLKSKFVSLNQVLEKAQECGFTETEQALIHVIAQIEAIPDFIELGPFFERLAPVHAALFQEPIDETTGEDTSADMPETLSGKPALPLKLEMARLGSSRSSRPSSRRGTARRATSRRVSSATEKRSNPTKQPPRAGTSRKR